MTKLYVYPYKPGSQSARSLAEALQAPLIRHTRSKFVGNPAKVVVNWGTSQLPDRVERATVLNKAQFVKQAGNKLRFFQTVEHQSSSEAARPRLVPWTADKPTAQRWLDEGHTVVARTVLTGHSGSGIVIVSGSEELPDAPLYTRYVPKDSEFRVHISGDEVVDVQKKIRDPNQNSTTWKVRSHSNGFMFVRNGFVSPPDVVEQSLRTFRLSGLDFGAVDVVWNNRKQQAFVLEINCACGLEGSTVQVYAEGITKLINERMN